MLTSDVPQSHVVLETTSTNTQPSVQQNSPPVPLQRQREVIFKERVAATDLRIGLNLLGEHGRMLYEQYMKTKRQ